MAALSKPTVGGTDYAARIGLLFDAFNNGNYQFPATQVPSADANTLDDYEEGTFTPSITFDTPGDLAVTYSTRAAEYTKIGREVISRVNMTSSAFTHTTASGFLRIGGFPFTAGGSLVASGALLWGGITKASYTNCVARMSSAGTSAVISASGSGQAASNVGTADVPTGGTVRLECNLAYMV